MSGARPHGWIREPLLHFLLIGAVLFAIFEIGNEEPPPDRIVISRGEVASLAARWQAQRGRPPSDAELRSALDETIRTKVLAKEAVALGLDRDDSVVERRLAQKLEFVLSDVAPPDPPSDQELLALFNDRRDSLASMPRISFSQIFFNVGENPAAAVEAARALKGLRAGTLIDVTTLGDPTLLASSYTMVTPRSVSSSFGESFSDALFSSAEGVWLGPIRSAYGLHLVRIEARSDGEPPDFESSREDLQAIWIRERQRDANEAFYQTLLDRYEVVVEETR